LLAEQIQCFHGLFGEADNSPWGEHQTLTYPIGQTSALQTPTSPETQPIPKISAASDLFQTRFKVSG
jgi:hypothetical protein